MDINKNQGFFNKTLILIFQILKIGFFSPLQKTTKYVFLAWLYYLRHEKTKSETHVMMRLLHEQNWKVIIVAFIVILWRYILVVGGKKSNIFTGEG